MRTSGNAIGSAVINGLCVLIAAGYATREITNEIRMEENVAAITEAFAALSRSATSPDVATNMARIGVFAEPSVVSAFAKLRQTVDKCDKYAEHQEQLVELAQTLRQSLGSTEADRDALKEMIRACRDPD